MPQPSRSRIAAAAVAIGLTVAGCTSTADAPDVPSSSASAALTGANAVVVTASQQTVDTGSARFSATMSTSGITKEPTTVSMEGSIDFTNNNVQATLRSKSFGDGGQMRLISVNGALYIQTAPSAKWLKTASSDVGDIPSPSEGLANLRELTGLKKTGTDTIEGVTATRYEGTLDLGAAMASAQTGDPQTSDLAKQLAGATTSVTVWIDGEGRVIRFANMGSVKTGDTSSGGSGNIKYESTMTFFDFGAPTDIQAPPDSEVVDSGNLQDMMEQ